MFLPVGTHFVKTKEILKHINEVSVRQKKDAGRLDRVKVIFGEINKAKITNIIQPAHKICAACYHRKVSTAKNIGQARVWKEAS